MACRAALAACKPTSPPSVAGFVPFPLRTSLARLPPSSFMGARLSASISSPLCHVSASSPPVATPSAGRLQVLAAGYKLKTHKATAKRFRVTGTGKVMRRQACRAHLLRKKNTRRKNRLAGMVPVFRGDIDKIVGAAPHLRVDRQLVREEMVEEEEEEEEVEPFEAGGHVE